MIVVAILGILSAVVFPVYQQYMARSKLSEVVIMATVCRTAIHEGSSVGINSVRVGNDWGCGEGGGVASLSQYVSHISTAANGTIYAYAKNILPTDVDGQSITLTPYADQSATVVMVATDYVVPNNIPVRAWKCSFSGNARYAPPSCR